MKPDDTLCYCFHISRRKVVNFLRLRKPRVPSQLSECGGAGTGCGWCVPFLKRLHTASKTDAIESTDVELTADSYAQQRGSYLRDGGGVAPSGAIPPPDPVPDEPPQ